MTLEYQLGYFVGEYIFANILPTLSIDSLHSRKVIYVTAAEGDKYRALRKEWSDNYKNYDNKIDNYINNSNWIELRTFHNELAVKYLPHILTCHIPMINFETIPNINNFKQGLRDSLWNTDLCWYAIKTDDDIEIISGDDWFNKINLKLDVNL